MQSQLIKGGKSIVVISAGAVGSLFGGIIQGGSSKLLPNKVETVLNCDYKDHYDTIKHDGLRLTPINEDTQKLWKVITNQSSYQMKNGSYYLNMNIYNSEELKKFRNHFDYAIIIQKSYQTNDAAKLAQEILKDDGVSITFQNGMGNVETLQSVLGKERVMQGSLSHNAFLKEPGHVIHGGSGYIMISPIQDSLVSKAEWLCSLFKTIGLECNIMTSGVDGILWSKLLVNACINSLTALYECKTGGLLNEYGLHMVKNIVNEGLAVCDALHVTLPEGDAYERVVEVIRKTQGSYSSMCSDMMRKRPTEIDAICGYITKKGKEVGVQTPINEMLTDLIHNKEHLYERK
ncbi:hypothetical protein WA158_001834 [Blastocystis sp. Blastoise]